MIGAFLLSVAQLGDRAIRGVLLRSFGVTLVLFVLAGGATWWAVDRALANWAWGGTLAGAIAGIAVAAGLWLAFRAVAILVVGLFADTIVEAVERRHYPDALASAHAVPLRRSLAMGIASAARFVGINLLLLPVYVGLLATGIGTAAAFLAVNAWLLGRDLGDMVAVRQLSPAAMRDWRTATQARRFLLGLAASGMFMVPVLNILAPVLGAAMATHLFHRTHPSVRTRT